MTAALLSSKNELAPHQPAAPSPFFDTMLRDGDTLTRRLLEPDDSVGLMRKMLALAVGSFATYGLLLGLMAQAFPKPLTLPSRPMDPMFEHVVVWMPVSLTLSFLIAIAVGLPSFYFYTQLAGLNAPFRLITALSLRVHARSSVFLLGAMPFFFALALLEYVFLGHVSPDTVGLGILVPFVCGLCGLVSLYKSFGMLSQVLPRNHTRRGKGMMRLVACWALLGATVAPVAMWRIASWMIDVL